MGDQLKKARIAFTGKMASMTRKDACALVREAGGEPAAGVSHRTDLLVVGMEGWPLLPDGEISHKLRHAKELQDIGCPICIVSETAFLELAGKSTAQPAQRIKFPAHEVCRVLKISAESLRRWEHLGLIQSRDENYEFQDLVSIQTIHNLVGHGVRPEKIARSLRDLASILPGFDKPLAQLRVIAENPGDLFVDFAGTRFSPTGQLFLDFDGRRREECSVLPLNCRTRSLNEWFDLGIGCEEEGLYAEATEAFQTVLALDPDFSQAYFHLGNVMREMGILWAAEDFYLRAARMQSATTPAWCSLAEVQEEQGKTEDAIVSYQAALAANPDCADGLFNLALCFEKAGRKLDARRHWFLYLKLDPCSASSQVAKRYLSIGPEA